MKNQICLFCRICSAMAFILLMGIVTGAFSAPAQSDAGGKDVSRRSMAREMLSGTQELELIVELSDPALLDRIDDGIQPMKAAGAERVRAIKRRMDFSTHQASAYRMQIAQMQKPVERKMQELPGTTVLRTTSVLMNTITIRTAASNYQKIRRMPGVRKVYFSRQFKPQLDSAGAIHNAQALWNAVDGQSNAGKGIKIGIIDSGIDLKNEMFSGAGMTFPAGFPKYNNNNLAFTNPKVIVARSYVTDTVVDDFGHGSFVAACAAGLPVSAPLAHISGMAPGAYLGNYDVLDWRGSTTTTAIISAVDDAVADGMDVINLSLGAVDFLPPEESALYQILQKATQAGIIVVAAAGNSGSGTFTISNSGTMSNVITVGSATSLREFLPVIHTSIPGFETIGYVSSLQGALISVNVPSTKIVDVASLDGNGLGCSRFPAQSLAGSIALIERGGCMAVTKVTNAQAAGAVGVIVYNNSPIGMTQMTGLENRTALTRWAVMISMNDGLALKRYIAENPAQARVSIDKFNMLQSVPIAARIISEFSSVGPSTDFGIKPDLVAIGENVYSATTSEPYFNTMYDPSGFTSSQGTSFSAPLVAGAAAALLAKFPDLTASEIKSVLTSTASRNVTVDGTNQADILRGGSGLLNMGDAAAATATFVPSSMSFGAHAYSSTYSDSRTLTIKNISAAADEFIIDYEPLVAGPEITFSRGSTGPLEPGSSVEVVANLAVTAPASGGFQGFITVTSSSTSFVYRIPYWAGLYVPDSQRVLQVSSNASATGTFRSLADAVASARPGNIVEIADSGTYSTGENSLVISTNGEGLPLHGLTIRAAAGKSPAVEVPADTVGLTVVGVENVRLQGLKIRGGAVGVRLMQPSVTVPTSVTLDRATISGASNYGIYIDSGGSLEVVRTTVENSADTGLVANGGGSQITITGSTFRGNQYDGADIYESNVNILDSTFSGNRGDGILLFSCTGVLAGNTISANKSYLQDYIGNGIEIFDGNLTVRKNRIEGNDAVGILRLWFSSDSAARFVGNIIQSNKSYGLFSFGLMDGQPDSFILDGNLIQDNADGVYLGDTGNGLLVNNLILRSTDPIDGDGIFISGGNNIRIVNNTIYKNAGVGVWVDSGTVTIANSIIRLNAGGETLGVNSNSIRSSITSGNPGLVNPDIGDYAPAAGLAAIDRGANDVEDLPFLDYFGRLRVASQTDLPGRGTVDIGAVEANSAYPLVYPLIVNGNESTFAGSFFTGIVYSNPTNTPMQFHFTAFGEDGEKLAGSAYAQDTLGKEAQKATLGFQMFEYPIDDSFMGSVLGYSDKPAAGFFLLIDSGFQQFSTGTNAAAKLEKDLVFMRHQSDADRETSYVIFNPGVNTANLTAKLYDSDGRQVGASKRAAIPAKGRTILRFESGMAAGYVRVVSDRPIAGVELVGYKNIMAALGGVAPDSQARLYFPHFAVGGHYSTQVGIVNSSDLSAGITLKAYDDMGNCLGTADSIELRAGGQLMKTVSELFGIPVEGPLRTGYLIAEADQPGIMGYTDFSYSDAGRISDATIPADSIPSRRLLFSHVAHGVNAGNGLPYQTGIALLNPFGTNVEYTMSVYDGSGRLVARSDFTIGPRQKVSKILAYPDPAAAFFTNDLVLGNGHIEVTSDYGLIGLELFFTTDLSQLASVPAQIAD